MIPKGFSFVIVSHFQKHLAKSFQMFCLNHAQHGQYYARHKESMFVLVRLFLWISWNGIEENMKYEKLWTENSHFYDVLLHFYPCKEWNSFSSITVCCRIVQNLHITFHAQLISAIVFFLNSTLKFGESSGHTHFHHFSH